MRQYKNIIGIDPGVNGGIAVILNDPKERIVKYLEPIRPSFSEEDTVLLLHEVVDIATEKETTPTICYFERVHYKKGDGGKGAFTFGAISAFLRAPLLYAGVKVRRVPPMIWMGRLECLTGGNKNITKMKAKRLFCPHALPPEKITHNTADALLIAEYGRLRERERDLF